MIFYPDSTSWPDWLIRYFEWRRDYETMVRNLVDAEKNPATGPTLHPGDVLRIEQTYLDGQLVSETQRVLRARPPVTESKITPNEQIELVLRIRSEVRTLEDMNIHPVQYIRAKASCSIHGAVSVTGELQPKTKPEFILCEPCLDQFGIKRKCEVEEVELI